MLLPTVWTLWVVLCVSADQDTQEMEKWGTVKVSCGNSRTLCDNSCEGDVVKYQSWLLKGCKKDLVYAVLYIELKHSLYDSTKPFRLRMS